MKNHRRFIQVRCGGKIEFECLKVTSVRWFEEEKRRKHGREGGESEAHAEGYFN